MDFNGKSENEIIVLARNGDAEAMEFLFNKYKSTVRAIARPYYLIGGDKDDLIQEGMIGIFRAIKNYNEKYPFGAYVYKCIKSCIISLIRRSTQQKNAPLNNYVSFSGYDDNDMEKSDIVMDEKFEPEMEYINNEAEEELKSKISNLLSPFENTILTLYLQGYSYQDIADKVGKNFKSIDNALQRIRKKILLSLKQAG